MNFNVGFHPNPKILKDFLCLSGGVTSFAPPKKVGRVWAKHHKRIDSGDMSTTHRGGGPPHCKADKSAPAISKVWGVTPYLNFNQFPLCISDKHTIFCYGLCICFQNLFCIF